MNLLSSTLLPPPLSLSFKMLAVVRPYDWAVRVAVQRHAHNYQRAQHTREDCEICTNVKRKHQLIRREVKFISDNERWRAWNRR